MTKDTFQNLIAQNRDIEEGAAEQSNLERETADGMRRWDPKLADLYVKLAQARDDVFVHIRSKTEGRQ
jgi:hypothetical protein